MQYCDLLWNLDAAYHLSLATDLAIRICRRKQDVEHFGLDTHLPPGGTRQSMDAR